MAYVQADLGHTSIDVTDGVYNAAPRDPTRSAVDLVADTLANLETPATDKQEAPTEGPTPVP
jgi:hypothetical protein